MAGFYWLAYNQFFFMPQPTRIYSLNKIYLGIVLMVRVFFFFFDERINFIEAKTPAKKKTKKRTASTSIEKCYPILLYHPKKPLYYLYHPKIGRASCRERV